MSNLQTRAAGLQRTTNGNPTTANPGTEVDAVADYVLTSGTKCGPQTITGKKNRGDLSKLNAILVFRLDTKCWLDKSWYNCDQPSDHVQYWHWTDDSSQEWMVSHLCLLKVSSNFKTVKTAQFKCLGSKTPAMLSRCVSAKARRGSPVTATQFSLTGGPLESAPTKFCPPQIQCLCT